MISTTRELLQVVQFSSKDCSNDAQCLKRFDGLYSMQSHAGIKCHIVMGNL